ncbi:MAG: IPT/TIG domain-containing protein [Deltaproteobacteria bacterium]|nr:IPT/TIG domain-containing protein [Deltaproteobacteria bacterium]
MRRALIALPCLTLAACLGPAVIEVRLVSDTDATGGGHEVLALVRDPTGVTGAELLFAGMPAGGAPVDPAAVTRRPMDRVADGADPDGVRFAGRVGAFPWGTTVRYAVRACNRLGACCIEPPAWPDESFAFSVGRLPSAPQVTSVLPPYGPTSGGVRVTVTGVDFRAGMDLTVDGLSCGFVEVVRPDLAYCTLPAGEEGPADITATNPDLGQGTLRDGFIYYRAPRVLRVVPDHGPTAGDTPVLVEGQDFVDGTRVTFQGRHARFVTVVSSFLIQCRTPPGNAGFADVAALHPLGGEGVLPQGYRYVPPPVVDAVEPPEGPDFGGQVVVVTGHWFEPGAQVTVGGLPCTDVVVLSAEELTCTVPAGAPGAADVTVVNPDGQEGTLEGGYYYNGPPVVLGVDPPDGPLAPGAEAEVLGAGFLPGMQVRFDGIPAEVLEAGSRDRVRVRVPGAAEPVLPAPPGGERRVRVEVQNPPPDGRSAGLDNAYTYLWPPEPLHVVPGRGPTRGGTDVVITGRFFRSIRGEAITVEFDGAAATDVLVVSATELNAKTPPGEPGPADVGVRNHPLSLGVGAALYVYIPPPEVTSVVPPDGPTFGGDVVVVHGRYFQPGAVVTIDGAPCDGAVVSADGTQITCRTPPGERGPADVRVVNPDAQEDTLERGYTYVGLAVQPPGGFDVGFTRVRVRSAGMRPGVRLFFGTVEAGQVTRVSDRELIAQSPAHALGSVAVRFLNPDGTGESEEGAFQYRTLVPRQGAVPAEFDTGNDAEVADLDGDGDLDVAVANGDVDGPERSVVYLSRLAQGGGPVFERRVFSPVLTANQVSLGDLDGDGRPELLLAASEQTHLFRNDGAANFSEMGMPSQGDGAFEATVADFSADGVADVLILNIGCSNFDTTCDESVVGRDNLFFNTGGGAFQDASGRIPHDRAQVHDHKLEVADLDGNGRNDIVIVVDNKNYQGPDGVGYPRHRVLLNLPGGFQETDVPDLQDVVGDVYGIALGDLDGDGRADLVMPSYVPSNVGIVGRPGNTSSTVILMGVPGADFVRDDTRLGVPTLDEPTISTIVADLDGDGDLEILACNLDDVSRIFVNRGDGTFVPAPGALPQESLGTSDLVPGDFDDDGDLDLFMVNHGQDRLLLAQPER